MAAPKGRFRQLLQAGRTIRFVIARFVFRFSEKCDYLGVIPRPQEGRIAIVTDVGRGMRWTQRCCKTSGAEADGEIVWSWHPDAGVKLRGLVPRSDGG
jgi:hypothetical protein